jgi:hypothetical protein
MNLLAYIQGKRKGKEAHRIEKEAMKDPFLADALDGFDTVAADHIEQINLIRNRLSLETERAGKRRMYIGIAASLLLCLSIGGYFLWKSAPDQLIALSDSPAGVESAPAVSAEKEAELSMNNQGYPDNQLTQSENQRLQTEEQSFQEDNQFVRSKTQSLQTHTNPLAESSAIALPPPPASPVEQKIAEKNAEIQVIDERTLIAADSVLPVARKAATAPIIVQAEAADMAATEIQQEEAKALSNMQAMNKNATARKVANKNIDTTQNTVPEPIIGMEAYEKYLKEAQILPTKDDCLQVNGVVEIKFTLKAGKPTDFVILKSLCPAADKEAIRLIENGCPWIGADGQSAILKVVF